MLFGLAAQTVFMLRFIVQWIASERRKRSYVPVMFWYFSLLGGVMLLSYAVKKHDPVFILGQGLGCLIYVRNLRLIQKRKSALRVLTDLRRDLAALDPADAVFETAPAQAAAAPQPSI